MSKRDWNLDLGDRYAENRHKGPVVLVSGGPCHGQEVKLPVIYSKVIYIALAKALPLKLYWPYVYNHTTQVYEFRQDLSSIPTDTTFWGYP